MITLSNTVKEIANSGYMNFFYTIEIGADKRYTSAPFPVTLDNGITYDPTGGLVTIEPPRVSATVDRAVYKIALADPEMLLKYYFEAGATGDRVVVRAGFFNTLGREVDSTLPGQYFKQVANTLIVYKGVIDAQTYDIDLAGGTALAGLECSSPMADLDLVKSFFTNESSMNSRNPNDTCFKGVFDGAAEVAFLWGKK